MTTSAVPPVSGTSRSLVRLDKVTFGYTNAPVLKDITHSIEPGAFTGIVGPSGSGKTSLLRLLLGLGRVLALPVHRVVVPFLGRGTSVNGHRQCRLLRERGCAARGLLQAVRIERAFDCSERRVVAAWPLSRLQK